MLLAFCIAKASIAQEIRTLTWATKHAAPPATLPKPAADFLPAFRIAIQMLPESNVVALALSQPAILGLDQASANRLQSLCAVRYHLIERDPIFRGTPSCLSYCYSSATPTNGLALMYVPGNVSSKTPAIVFLHGYGGSFLWTLHLLAEAFPGYVIICPADGITSATQPSTYVHECLAAATREMGDPIARPTLMGLSAGGFAATRVYIDSPDRFRQLIVLAAYPPPATVSRFTTSMRIHFMAGSHEPYVRSGQFSRALASIRARGCDVGEHIVADADHYFLLGKRKETLRMLGKWLNTP